MWVAQDQDSILEVAIPDWSFSKIVVVRNADGNRRYNTDRTKSQESPVIRHSRNPAQELLNSREGKIAHMALRFERGPLVSRRFGSSGWHGPLRVQNVFDH